MEREEGGMDPRMMMGEEGAGEAYEDLARLTARRLTLELAQPLLNSHRRRKPRGWTDAPLFERQEELPL